LQAHYQSHTSQRYNLSFVKELAMPTHGGKLFKKFADTIKIKNADTQADRKEKSKMTMTRKLNKDNGLQDWKTEHQAVYFLAVTVRVSAFLHLINFRLT